MCLLCFLPLLCEILRAETLPVFLTVSPGARTVAGPANNITALLAPEPLVGYI